MLTDAAGLRSDMAAVEKGIAVVRLTKLSLTHRTVVLLLALLTIGLTAVMFASLVLIAQATTFAMLMAARALLGADVAGGLQTMAAAAAAPDLEPSGMNWPRLR